MSTLRADMIRTLNENTPLKDYLLGARENMALTQREVAEYLGYSTPQFISNWERGMSYPPIQSIKKIAYLYKIDENDLFECILRTHVSQIEKTLRKKFKKK